MLDKSDPGQSDQPITQLAQPKFKRVIFVPDSSRLSLKKDSTDGKHHNEIFFQ